MHRPNAALLPIILAALSSPPSSTDRREHLSRLARSIVSAVAAGPSAVTRPTKAIAAGGWVDPAASCTPGAEEAVSLSPWRVTLPLEPCGGGAGCVRFSAVGRRRATTVDDDAERPLFPFLFRQRGRGRLALPFRVYRVIVDTGSPYLVVSSSGDNDGDVLSSGAMFDSARAAREGPLERWWNSFLEVVNEDLLLPYFPKLAADAFNVPFEFRDSPFGPTEEIYGSVEGKMYWKAASVSFRDKRLIPATKTAGKEPLVDPSGGRRGNDEDDGGGIVLGVMDESLTKESGGSLMGLVKRSNVSSTKIERRPTFLEQERITPLLYEGPCDNGDSRPSLDLNDDALWRPVDLVAFRLDYPNKELTVSGGNLIPPSAENVMRLVDLRPLGDFVEHYAVVAESVTFDGDVRVTSELLRNGSQRGGKLRDIVAVFDSGLTGCLLIRPFWDRLVQCKLDPSSFASVKVAIRTVHGSGAERKTTATKSRPKRTKESVDREGVQIIESSKSRSKLFYVSPISLDWFDDEETAPYVIVLGQTFLSQGALTIDIDDRRATFVVPKQDS